MAKLTAIPSRKPPKWVPLFVAFLLGLATHSILTSQGTSSGPAALSAGVQQTGASLTAGNAAAGMTAPPDDAVAQAGTAQACSCPECTCPGTAAVAAADANSGGGGGGSASGDSVCFSREDYEKHMFTAKPRPNYFLDQYLEQHKPARHYPSFQELLKTLHHTETSIYEGFALPPDMPEFGYGMTHVTDKTVKHLAQLHPEPLEFMVEVGSFVGNSAELFGAMMARTGGVLLCADSWTGDLNMVIHSDFVAAMARSRSGDPRIYDRFLHTIVQAGLTDTVMPLRLPSLTAARLVHVLGYIVDIVYLDSAHEAGETFMELSLWWEVLKPGGVMLGDDYAWQSVRHDLDLFVKMHNLELLFNPEEGEETWYLKKPL